MVSTNGLYDLKLWSRKLAKKPTTRAKYVHIPADILSLSLVNAYNYRLTAEPKPSSHLLRRCIMKQSLWRYFTTTSGRKHGLSLAFGSPVTFLRASPVK